MRQRGAGARPVGVPDQGRKAAECHPGEDHEADVDVDVGHRGDAMYDYLTQDAALGPD